MAVTKERKVEIMNDLVAKFKNAKSIWFATTNTVTVEEFAELRKNLREVDATYTLAKKTIIKKALKEATWLDIDLADLPGQIWVVCSNDDPMAWLWRVNSFMKEANWPKWDKGKLAWSISVFEWEVKTVDETKVLASMPSRDTLLWRLVGTMKAPISALARFFDSASKELEKTGKTSVWELDWKAATPATETPKEEPKDTPVEKSETEEAKTTEAEEPKVEDVKEEAPTEAPENSPEEKIEETPKEEKSEEVAEVPNEEATGEKEDTPSEEKKAE